MDAVNDVEIISRETVFKGYFQIDRYRLRHRTFKGDWSAELVREVFERGHAVAVLLYDPDRDEVGLIEQFRPGALAAGWNPWLIECVAGIIEEGEHPDDVARRETREEAGAEPSAMVHVGDYLMTAGGASETCRLYCARVDSRTISGLHGLEAEGEDIRTHVVSSAEALAMVRDGRINNAMAVIALQWLAMEKDRLRREWGPSGT
ncbi:NUDIX domain-containing protein [Magnetospirillum molischianum]|uniref:ADP-ribose pyrophosphatase n=1 Tax=Magnetospirillum molischianum DSM 120 TaxID=1150626 RepID=H8FNY4_MAGML|nr:NUDIX domain-containing protein [Magnetospirillum molischianum]CCG40072.1 ADP-ribose pyrophosphatase [Magnetospirillum molischianum DSM 120]